MRRQKTELLDIKTFNVRLPKHLWLFLKDTSATQEVNMIDIIVMCLEKYKKKLESKLTTTGTHV